MACGTIQALLDMLRKTTNKTQKLQIEPLPRFEGAAVDSKHYLCSRLFGWKLSSSQSFDLGRYFREGQDDFDTREAP